MRLGILRGENPASGYGFSGWTKKNKWPLFLCGNFGLGFGGVDLQQIEVIRALAIYLFRYLFKSPICLNRRYIDSNDSKGCFSSLSCELSFSSCCHQILKGAPQVRWNARTSPLCCRCYKPNAKKSHVSHSKVFIFGASHWFRIETSNFVALRQHPPSNNGG